MLAPREQKTRRVNRIDIEHLLGAGYFRCVPSNFYFTQNDHLVPKRFYYPHFIDELRIRASQGQPLIQIQAISLWSEVFPPRRCLFTHLPTWYIIPYTVIWLKPQQHDDTITAATLV